MRGPRGRAGRNGGGGRMRGRNEAAGFTLIEVLVALAIVAIALGAVLRAIGALTESTELARVRQLALWSADNALGEIVIARTWPPLGQTEFDCPQGRYRFMCRRTVSTAAASPLLRDVSVTVFQSRKGGAALAAVATQVQDDTPR
jgi:general secretion pathway protein I